MSKATGDYITVKIKRDNNTIEKKIKPNVIETKTLGTYFKSTSSEPKIKYIEEI